MNIQKKISKYNRLRWACRGVVILSTATSIWANILHSEQAWIPIGINSMPPIIILLGFEMSSRIPLWEGPWFHPRRWARPISMVGITAIGGWLSYWHQRSAFLRYSKEEQTAMLLPLAIDGLMIIASVAILDLGDRVNELLAWLEGDKVTTYKPRDPEVPIKAKAEVGPSKKQLIADMFTRYPEWKPAQIAEKVGATPSYAYGVMKALKEEAEKAAANGDMEPATA
jgi:hypothetical protein